MAKRLTENSSGPLYDYKVSMLDDLLLCLKPYTLRKILSDLIEIESRGDFKAEHFPDASWLIERI